MPSNCPFFKWKLQNYIISRVRKQLLFNLESDEKNQTMRKYLALVIFVLCWNTMLSGQTTGTLTEDGAWCWFSDPRAIYAGDQDHRSIVTGWVTKNGDIEVAALNLQSGEITNQIIYPELQVDDHDNPAFLELPDHRILTQFAWHGGDKGVIQNTTTRPMDITCFGKNVVFKPKTAELLEQYKRETYTYANPYMLAEENNKLYSFGRWVGFKPNMITSTDNGQTWSDPRVVITSPELDVNNRPYVKYYSDGKSRIHLVFTDGHPAVEPLNSVYYCYYENDAFWKADGQKICNVEDLPFHPSDATVVYKATEESGRAWIFDIAADANDLPIILYSRYPRVKQHDYYYARWDGDKWHDHKIIYSGPWFPEDVHGQRQRELNYSGGLTLDPVDPSIIYFSHVIDGVFEISRGETPDFGRNWGITPITRDSEYDNVRPYVPRYQQPGDQKVVLWMQNKSYIHYTDYDCSIRYILFPE